MESFRQTEHANTLFGNLKYILTYNIKYNFKNSLFNKF